MGVCGCWGEGEEGGRVWGVEVGLSLYGHFTFLEKRQTIKDCGAVNFPLACKLVLYKYTDLTRTKDLPCFPFRV